MIEISACVIVKNEAENLPSWLNCVKQLADEIIVVDTGSTDDSKQIAQTAGAKVYDFVWINDFAAAKNYAISKAKGNWILFLDADETITPETIANVRPLIKRFNSRTKVVAFGSRLINREKKYPYDIRGYMIQIRLFRRQHIHYFGAIHEALDIPVGYTVELTKEFEINHTGYSSEIVRAKLKRNLQLIHDEIAKNDGKITPLKHKYLMDCHHALDDYDKAIYHAQAAIEGHLQLDLLTQVYEKLIAFYRIKKKSLAEILEVLADAIKLFPQNTEFIIIKGLCLADAGKYSQAYEYLQQGITAKTDDINLVTLVNVKDKYLPTAYFTMGAICYRRHQYTLGQEHLMAAILANKYNRSILLKVINLWRDYGLENADIILILNKIYTTVKDREQLADCLQLVDELVLASYYYRHSNNENKAKLLSGNEIDKAAEYYKTMLNWQTMAMVVGGTSRQASNATLKILLPKTKYAMWTEWQPGQASKQPMYMSLNKLYYQLLDKRGQNDA